MIDIEKWTADYLREVEQTFGTRIAFVGIQGSYARGEAKEDSDIDMVLILDHLEPADLPRYREAVEELPERRLLCGFVSGLDELKCWDRADLFQFCHDTLPIRGSLEELLAVLESDEKRILSAADFSEETFDEQSQLLQQWTSGLIVSMGDRQD